MSEISTVKVFVPFNLVELYRISGHKFFSITKLTRQFKGVTIVSLRLYWAQLRLDKKRSMLNLEISL